MAALLGSVLSLLSALALYAGSRHCRWPLLRRAGLRGGTPAGVALAIAALVVWCAGFGIGAGLSMMLTTWMAPAMALPYVAAWHGRAPGSDA